MTAAVAAVLGVATLALVAPLTAAATSVTTPRYAGTDRYATSAELSRAAFPNGAGTVVLASGTSFADGLAASALAGQLGAPILLVPPKGPLPGTVSNELTRLRATTARIVGGSAAVSVAVSDELTRRGVAVGRIAGRDRYETASSVAARIGTSSIGRLRSRRTAFLATGATFPDALAASAPAYAAVEPILLTTSATLSADAARAIDTLGIEQVVVLGGTDAISESVARAVGNHGATVLRVAGADRGATAHALADLAVTPAPDGFGFGTTSVVVTSGLSFPDALAAAPLAASSRAPVLFASPTTTAAESFLTLHRSTITTLAVAGGSAAVPSWQVDRLVGAVTSPTNQTFRVSPAYAQRWTSVPYASGDASTFVRYVATGISSNVTRVSIALADPAAVHVAGDGTVSFDRASGTPTRAELANARVGDLRIRAVNDSGISPATSVTNVAVSNGTVSFRVAVGSTAALGSAVPVVYEASNGNMLVGADGHPTDDFAIGGQIDAVPAESATGGTTTVTVFSVGSDSFVGAVSSTTGRLFYLRDGDDDRIGGVGGTGTSNRAAFVAALSVGDTVVVTYNQRLSHAGGFVANVFNLTNDVVAAPTNVSAATLDTNANGAVDTVRLSFVAPRTGLPTTGTAKVRRFAVTNGVVGTTPTDIVTSWTYTSGTSAQVDLTGGTLPPVGTYVFQVALRGMTGTSYSAFSASSNAVTIASTGLGSVPSAPIATSITVADSSPAGLDPGDVLTVTFNEPMQLTSGVQVIELRDGSGDRATLQLSGPTNATFAVGGTDSNVLTVTVTGAPTITSGSGPIAFGSSTTIFSVSSTFRDRDATPRPWDPTPANTLGAGGTPLGVSSVPGSAPVVPFTLSAAGGKITLNSVTDVVRGAAGAAVPGALVSVSAVGGSGGSAADAAASTRRQAVAAADGSFTITLSSATTATTVQLLQSIQRTVAASLTSAVSPAIPAQPVLDATSSLGGTVDGVMADGDTITLRLTGAMTTAGITSFDVSVSRADPNVITVAKAGTSTVVLTITATGVRYNGHATDAMTFDGSPGVWSAGSTVLTITLANRSGGTPQSVSAAHPSSWVAGPALLDAGGVVLDTSPVVGATSRF